MRLIRVPLSLAILTTAMLLPTRASAQHYVQTNLVSDVAGAQVVDPNLRNGWGLTHGATTPWWVSANHTGTSTVYDTSTSPPTVKPTVVTIPAASPGDQGSPTGIVYNGSPTDFLIEPGKAAVFIWVTEDGTVSGWNPAVNATKAIIKVNNSQKPAPGDGAIYKGATIAEIEGHKYLLAADFHHSRIDIFDTTFRLVQPPAGFFVDSQIPTGYGPFNVQGIGPNVYVAYAKQDSDREDEVAGPGLGFVDVFTPSGQLLQRLQRGNWLNAPWGMTLAPAFFGEFSHALLVGNFGSGTIAAYNSVTGRFIGNMLTPSGATLAIDGLWGIAFGNGGASGPANSLFFAAGPNDENDGLFGALTPVASELNEDDEQ